MDWKIEKMKKLFLVVLLFICSCSYGQEYKVVDIKGYYMVSYRKNEIAAKYENTMRKVFRQSYATAIDYSTRSFFVPTQINDSICNFENILNIFIVCIKKIIIILTINAGKIGNIIG